MIWDADKLWMQLALGEDSRVEFKEAVFDGNRVRGPRRERVANELAAFGNTLGGALIFSVSDTGEVRPVNREEMDALESYISEICADRIRPPLRFTKQRLALPDGLSTLIVEVPQSALVQAGRTYENCTGLALRRWAVPEGGRAAWPVVPGRVLGSGFGR